MSLQTIKQSLTKAQAAMVECFDEDSEVYEVVLHSPYINQSYDETVWVFGKHHLESGMTVDDMLKDLQSWLGEVVKG